MRGKIIISSIIFITFFVTLKGVISTIGKNNSQDKDLSLEIIPAKNFFSLGELVKLKFKFTNESSESVRLGNYLDAKYGYLKILISQDGINYKEYSHANWGTADIKRGYISLKPGESVETSVKILWNYVPNVANISRISKKQLITNYAFPTKGNYFVKAISQIQLSNKIEKIESEPVQITLEKPVGDDLEVWNKIKDNGEIAYFIQEGDLRIPSYKTEERENLRQEIEQIIIDHPNSFYAESLRQSLEKFQSVEAKRKEYSEKIKQPN